MLEIQALASRNMSEELQTIFQADIIVVNFVKIHWEEDPLQIYCGKTHGAPILVKHAGSFVPKCFTAYLNWKE